MFKKLKAVKYGPREKLPKAAGKDQNHSLPNSCSAAQRRIKAPRPKAKPKMLTALPKTTRGPDDGLTAR